MNENTIVAITKLNEIVTDIDKDDTCFLDIKDTVEEVIALLKAKDTNVPTKWVSVEEALPTEEGQDCWVWCRELGEPELDNWEGGHGEKAVASMGPNETREFIKSGWYYNDMQPITHWMPVDAPKVPEPPKEEDV